MDDKFNMTHVATCLLVGTDPQSLAVTEGVVRSTFPGITLTCAETFEAAAPERVSGLGLLVLIEPDAKQLQCASQAVDTQGLPQWAIVVLTEEATGGNVESVPRVDWNPPLLIRVLKAAVAQHQLRRENARLRGDLRSVAQRVVHDLRTPLSGVLSAGEALNEVLSEQQPDNTPLIKPLFDSVQDMKRLLERISLLLHASACPIPKVPVAMGDIIFRVLQRSERQILDSATTVSLPESWPEVRGVFTWLEVVWSNLLVNALQHGLPHSQLSLGWMPIEGSLRFWLLNPHGGIPPEKAANLFQPFHLLHQPNARRGLGLSIVQRLVELQSGTCGYESLAGGGAKFFFTLPHRNGAHPPPVSLALPPEPLSPIEPRGKK
jgi:signal transduction histidine kinase